MEIPADLQGLSVKELKNILDAVGMKRDDCFEKSDLIKRIEEYKANKKKGKGASAADSTPKNARNSSTN